MIKKKFYLAISIILVSVAFFIYQKIFKTQKSEIKEIKEENSLSENSNNLIKNLKYSVNFENNTSYSITAVESELIDENNIDYVVQINSKKRLILNESRDLDQNQLMNRIKLNIVSEKYLKNKNIYKIIFVKNRLINLLINE